MPRPRIDPKIWLILTEDEKAALDLHYVQKKSSWEAGEITKRSHYKYLEIQGRAKRFFEILTEHFILYDELIPEWLKGDKEVKTFFDLTMTARYNVNTAYKKLDELYGRSGKKGRNRMIVEQMEKWRQGDANEQTIYGLIKEFDRWNNFRILPPEIREPSAFKRRNKNLHKRHVKITCNLPKIAVEHIREMLKPTGRQKYAYLPVITLEHSKEIIKIKTTSEATKFLTETQLYIYRTQNEAQEYIDLVAKYRWVEERSCKDGLNFWPKYREIIKRAINYQEIQKIVPTRKELIMALKKHEFY